MKLLIAFSVRRPWAALSMALAIAALGLWSAYKLTLDAVPDVTNIQVQVSTSVEGLAPVQIEQQVTFPIETALSGVPGVRSVRSISRPRLSQVTVVFDDGADIYRCRQLVAERLQTVREDLPPGSDPEMGPITTGLGEIYFYALEAKKPAQGAERVEQLMRLREIQEWEVKPRLLTVPGVAELNTSGGYRRQAVVKPRLGDLSRRGLHLDDLVDALKRSNRLTGGGVVEIGSEQFSVAAEGGLDSLDAIRRITLKADQSLAPVRLSEVADVAWEGQPRSGAATVNGREGMVNTVMMLAGENSRDVSGKVEKRLKEIAADLPDWMEVTTLYNRSDLVNATLSTVAHNLALGAILVVVVLFLMLGNARAAVISAITIPLAMLIAVIFMVPFKISGNLMSMGAIDFGILVDGAVIILDHCIRLVGERRHQLGSKFTRAELQQTVLQATLEASKAAGFGQFIAIVAVLPIFGLTGVEGKTFIPMAATLVFGLLGALLVSFTVAPALASVWLPTNTQDKTPYLMGLAQRYFDPLLHRCLNWAKPMAIAAIGMFGLSLYLFTRLGAVFMPHLDEGSLLIQFIRPQMISLSQSLALQEASEKLILEFGEVSGVSARIGTPELATDPMGVNLADTMVSFKPDAAWPKGPGGRRRSHEELAEAILTKLKAELPGQRILMTQPIQLRFNELLEGTRADVSVKVFGPDLKTLSDLAEKVAEVIKQVPGSGEVELEVRGTSPVLSVKPRYELLSRLGLAAGGVLEAVETALSGEKAGTFFGEGARRFPVMVRLAQEQRGDLKVMRSLPVPTGPADSRPLSELAEVRFVESYNSVSREQANRRAAVLVNPRGRDVDSLVQEARERVRTAVPMPSGYHLEWGGSFENLRVARQRLMVLTPLALILVFGMIYAAFGRVRLALLVFAGVPLAMIGGILGLWVRGIPFSISAGIGFIALAGIAVLNGVVLVSERLRLEKEGMAPRQAIVKAATSRLRPVLMTVLVEVFGFLPMMYSSGLGAEVQRPLATVVVCGVLSAFVLTMLMLPAWQEWIAGPKSDDFPPSLKLVRPKRHAVKR